MMIQIYQKIQSSEFSFISDDATLIMVNLFIRSFAKIDDVKMEYSVQITFRQKWSDDRLTYKHKLGHGDMQSKNLIPVDLFHISL